MRAILVFSIILISCVGLKQPKAFALKQACIDNLKNIINTNWKLSDDSIYYQTSSIFLSKLDTVYDECLNMLNQTEIISLFGTPTESHKMKEGFNIQSSFDYLVSLPCKDDADYSLCTIFVFYFDSDLRVVRSEMISNIGLKSH